MDARLLTTLPQSSSTSTTAGAESRRASLLRRRERERRSRLSSRWRAKTTLAVSAVALLLSGCPCALFGIGVAGAVKEASRWEETACGSQTKNSPYRGYETCAAIEDAARLFDVDGARFVHVEWRESTCTPTKGKPGPCIEMPYTPYKVAGYQSGSRTVVVAIHPDPSAPICRTALRHEAAHVHLLASNKPQDIRHERPEWKQANGCRRPIP